MNSDPFYDWHRAMIAKGLGPVPIPHGIHLCGVESVALGLYEVHGTENADGLWPCSRATDRGAALRAAMDVIDWDRLKLVKDNFWMNFDGSGVICISDDEHILISERKYSMLVNRCLKRFTKEEFNSLLEQFSEGQTRRWISGELEE